MEKLFRYLLEDIGLCDIPHYIRGGIFYLDRDWYLDDEKYIEYDPICGDIGLDYRIHNCTGLERLKFYYTTDSYKTESMDSVIYVWDSVYGYEASIFKVRKNIKE